MSGGLVVCCPAGRLLSRVEAGSQGRFGIYCGGTEIVFVLPYLCDNDQNYISLPSSSMSVPIAFRKLFIQKSTLLTFVTFDTFAKIKDMMNIQLHLFTALQGIHSHLNG